MVSRLFENFVDIPYDDEDPSQTDLEDSIMTTVSSMKINPDESNDNSAEILAYALPDSEKSKKKRLANQSNNSSTTDLSNSPAKSSWSKSMRYIKL